MSVIDEKTIKEFDKLYKGENYHMSDDLLVIAVMELIKEIRKQNELLNELQSDVQGISFNLDGIERTLDYLSENRG